MVIKIFFFLTFLFCQEQFSENKLAALENGVHQLVYNQDSYAILLVHGYYPPGWKAIHHELIEPLNYLSQNNIRTFLFKYDWNRCPDEIGKDLVSQLEILFQQFPKIDQWEIIGHSMGGTSILVANQMLVPNNKDITFHTVATAVNIVENKIPFWIRLIRKFQGFDRCDYNINSLNDEIENGFPSPLVEWRNIQAFDSQYKLYPFDVYDKKIKNSIVYTFPDSIDGERVGHTKSLYFSVLEIVRKLY
jgi:hypothetical protein